MASTGKGVDISVDGKTATLSPAVLQSHLRFDIGGGEVGVAFDSDALHATLENTIVGPVGSFVEPTFTVTDDVPAVLTPGEPPPVCCKAGGRASGSASRSWPDQAARSGLSRDQRSTPPWPHGPMAACRREGERIHHATQLL